VAPVLDPHAGGKAGLAREALERRSSQAGLGGVPSTLVNQAVVLDRPSLGRMALVTSSAHSAASRWPIATLKCRLAR
jgi:hypothetical protein